MSMTKHEYKKWLDSLPEEEREPDDRAQLEGSSIHSLRSAARDLAALGWRAHDLANEVAEAIAPPAPPTDSPANNDPIPY